jgi:putative FmdB family regulatory protein
VPIYEYECGKCGHHMEVLQRFSDPPLARCEVCKGKVKRLISQSTFHLKGSGWYVTDYAGKSKGGPEKSKGSGEKGSKAETPDSSTGSKKETAPKAKD